MVGNTRTLRRGFSLIELVIVVVIIGIIAAIAIPRMSRGAKGAGESALTGDLSVLRMAIDLYQTEHGGKYPEAAKINNQLTQYTDEAGDPVATKDNTHIYGPYVRAIPALKVGAAKGGKTIAAAAAAGVGWIYDETSGKISSNTTATEVDDRGVKFSDY